MSKKCANGEGNIRKRKDGRWEGRYTAGYNPETGKRIIPDSIVNLHKKILKDAGLPHIRFHDLRHPYVKPTTKKFITFFEVFRAAS